MARTRHINQRMAQRGINGRMVDLVSEYGQSVGDKMVLDRKNIDALLNAMHTLKKDLLRVRNKGGVVVVEENGHQLTTYNLNSYRH